MSTLRLAELAADVFPRGVLNIIAGAERAPAPRSSPTTTSTWWRSPAPSRPATGSPSARHVTLNASISSSAATRPSSSSTTSTSNTRLQTIAGAGYYNAGQDCVAATGPRRPDVYDDVVSGLAEQAKPA